MHFLYTIKLFVEPLASCYHIPVSPMAHTLHLVQIISSIILVGLILLQRTQGDTGSSFGDNTSFLQTRRGAERFLFVLTVALAVVFVGSSLAVIVL